MSIKVVLADDQALVRGGIRAILLAAGDIEIAGEAEDGATAVDVVLETHPDVVLMDVRMPKLDGIAATERIVAAGSRTRILIVTTFDLDEYVLQGLRAGASGFLLKATPPDRLPDAVRTVARGDSLLDATVTRRLVEHFLRSPTADTETERRLGELTDRELEVLRLLARGLSNADIGRGLHLSEATVKWHVTSVLAKLGVRSRVQAVVLAYETGLVRPGEAT
jgi:DNA-binding NarL/FixJ family response regulator